MSKKMKRNSFIIVVGMILLFLIGMQKVYYSIPKYMRSKPVVEAYAEENNSTSKETIITDIEELIEEESVEEIIEEIKEKPYDDETVEVLTNLLYGEARGIKDKAQQAAVIWCVLNRYDTGKYGKTIIDVATAKYQFSGYKKDRVYKDEKAYTQCKELVIDVLERYYSEEQEGRTLPKDYLYFVGFNGKNWFTNKWKSKNYWTWELESPYK